MPIRRRNSTDTQHMRKVLQAKQQYFNECVDEADVRHIFPPSPLDDVRDLSHHTIKVLECFAELILENHVPEEFERLAVCPVCNYKRVAEINEAVLIDKVAIPQIAEMHPYDELAIRRHVKHCLPRVSGVVANLIPRKVEVVQAKRVVDKLASLEEEVAELQRDAAVASKFKEAVGAAELRSNLIVKHGELTGEIERPDAHPKAAQIPWVIALHPSSPTPAAQLPSIDAEIIDDAEDD